MSPVDADASERFALLCPKCGRHVQLSRQAVSQEVRCPHCGAGMRVPAPHGGGHPVAAAPGTTSPGQRFNFSCPRCDSLLEAERGMSGQPGHCPTCAARFVIPELSGSMGRLPAAQLLDTNRQDPTPMHAYAASGHQAPRIRRLDDGTLRIECPRCGHSGDITANNCVGCGVPFTIEGVPTGTPPRGSGLATAALITGIVAVPFCWFIVPGGVAVLLGVASWWQRGHARPAGQALAGIVLGLISLALALLMQL